MNFTALCAASVLCFSIAVAAPAQEQTTQQNTQATTQQNSQDPCANPETTVEMRDCAGKEYKKADAELNKVYMTLMKELPDLAHQTALKMSQYAWIQFRDANCEFQSYLNRGGTMYPVVHTGCLSAMTIARTKELREALEQPEK